MSLSFDGRVAIVTGSGHGLGRSHALGLAARGARVLVNDLGGARDGTGASSDAARKVVEEIRAGGGVALANGADVADPDQAAAMVAQALETWGGVDILVNNAGILRDKTFHKMEFADFRKVLEVHLMGSVHSTRAVWEHMRERSYGRVVMTTSASGLYGNFGQSNYGAAKMALVGLARTLAHEGARYDIRVNCLAPAAATRMTEDIMPQPMLELLAPESVTPGLLALVDEEAPTGAILTAGAGVFACARIYETPGVYLPPAERTPERVRERWEEIAAPEGQMPYGAALEQTRHFLLAAGEALGLDLSAFDS